MPPRRRRRCAPSRTARTCCSLSTCRTPRMAATGRTAAMGRTAATDRMAAMGRTAATGRTAVTGRTGRGETARAGGHRRGNGGVAMTLARPQRGISAAQTRAVLGTVTPARQRRRASAVASAASLVMMALLVGAAPAAAQTVITGGPTTSPGGGWTCTAPGAGSEKLAGGGNYSCTGTSYPFSNLYIGINKNTTTPFGEKMNSTAGSEPTGAERFVWSTNPGTTQIQYTGQTSYNIDATAGGGSATAFTRITLTFSGAGTRV